MESFNNVLKNHYLTLRHDKSIFSLTKILLHCIFPDQEREYAVLTAKQSSLHRVPRKDIPEFLKNRPFNVQTSCIANMERSKKVPADSISEIHAKDGIYEVKSSSGNSVYDVNITDGTCSCPYFLKQNLPCKHIFSIFEHTDWSWKNLPISLTESPHMILEETFLKVNQSEPNSVIDVTVCAGKVDDHTDTGDHNINQEVDYDGNHADPDAVHSTIPSYHPSGKTLLSMQKKIRDNLAKCSAAVFMIDDISVLKEIDDKVNHIHTELLQTASTNLSSEQIPVMKCLMADESNEYKQRIHLISRANQLTKKYRTMRVKRKSNVSTCPLPLKQLKVKEDPLNKASLRSVGRPKGKKKRTV